MSSGKPLKYILNSDYATLKNDSDTETVILAVPSGDSISAGAYRTYTSDIVVGSPGAPMEWQINYSAGTQKFIAPEIQVVENTGSGNQYQGYVFIYRASPTTARLVVSYYNGTGSTVTTNARSVTATIRTFIPPFS